MKSLFRRVRPADYSDIEFRHGLRRPITSSFPSGHATAAFCAATLLGGGAGWYSAASAVAAGGRSRRAGPHPGVRATVPGSRAVLAQEGEGATSG